MTHLLVHILYCEELTRKQAGNIQISICLLTHTKSLLYLSPCRAAANLVLSWINRMIISPLIMLGKENDITNPYSPHALVLTNSPNLEISTLSHQQKKSSKSSQVWSRSEATCGILQVTSTGSTEPEQPQKDKHSTLWLDCRWSTHQVFISHEMLPTATLKSIQALFEPCGLNSTPLMLQSEGARWGRQNATSHLAFSGLTFWVKPSRVLCSSCANARLCTTSSYFSTAAWKRDGRKPWIRTPNTFMRSHLCCHYTARSYHLILVQCLALAQPPLVVFQFQLWKQRTRQKIQMPASSSIF